MAALLLLIPVVLTLGAVGFAAADKFLEGDAPAKPPPAPDTRSCDIKSLRSPVKFEYFTTGGAEWGDAHPTLILLHGLGATPRAIRSVTKLGQPAKVIVPRGPVKYGRNSGWWLTRAASTDQGKLADEMIKAAHGLRPLIQEVKRCNPGDIFAAGHSQGGMLAFALARMVPEVDGAVGGSGWLPERIQGPMAPTIAVHGSEDVTVPYARTRAWAQEASDVDFRSVPGAKHAIRGRLLDKWRKALDEMLASTR